eukprot:c4295_g1_i1 orf=34-210(-)
MMILGFSHVAREKDMKIRYQNQEAANGNEEREPITVQELVALGGSSASIQGWESNLKN